MNWVKELNDTEKEFYDKCADITITSTYLMEEVVKESIGVYQVLLINLTRDENMTVEDVTREFDKCFKIMEFLYKTSVERFKVLYNLYMEELKRILRNSGLQSFNMVKKRINFSQIKSNNIFKQSMAELKILGDNLIKNCIDFQNEFLEINKDEDKQEDITKNILEDVNKNFDKAKNKYNKIFKQRDLIKYLELNGFTYKNTGRHANYTDGVNTIPVPMHGSKDLGYGLQRKIQKEVVMNRNI
jgi:predicted RNA binding protein YcfA (HicA-like mRNA interferase family)